MNTTEVIKTEAHWGRDAYLNFVDDKVVFDCSWEEYGPIEFPISILEKALEKHKQKNEQANWLSRIMRYTRTQDETTNNTDKESR